MAQFASQFRAIDESSCPCKAHSLPVNSLKFHFQNGLLKKPTKITTISGFLAGHNRLINHTCNRSGLLMKEVWKTGRSGRDEDVRKHRKHASEQKRQDGVAS
jgi:hypothetical protein